MKFKINMKWLIFNKIPHSKRYVPTKKVYLLAFKIYESAVICFNKMNDLKGLIN